MTASSFLWIAFGSGLATSLGPCLVPRYLAVAAQIGSGAGKLSIASFLTGCVGGYVSFAAGGAILGVVRAGSSVVYGVAGVILAAAGLRYLLVAGSDAHRHLIGRNESLGARFLGGLCCSVFGAPCCAPIALALGVQSSAYDLSFGAMALAAFGAGQALPLAVVAAACRIGPLGRIKLPAEISATVGGTLLVAIGALYEAIA